MRKLNEVEGGKRPLLHHLNADSSWLLQVPIPPTRVASNEKRYFNILIDPWFQGPQSDVASWFSQQWHAIPSALRNIKEVENLALRVESNSYDSSKLSVIDVVTISHEFTDHCHKDTLLELSPAVPVFAPNTAAALIRSWDHFGTIIETPLFNSTEIDWRKLSHQPLPSWIAITRMIEPGNALYYHSAVTVIFESSTSWHTAISDPISENLDSSGQNENPASAECVVYTPHGITPIALAPISHASPGIQSLCLLHGLHDVALSPVQQLNLGGHNGLQVQRILKPKYWVATHDEVKKGGGLVSFFLRRKVVSLQDALDQEKTTGSIKRSDVDIDGSHVQLVEVGNGGSIVLE